MLAPILRTSRAPVQPQYVRCNVAARMFGVSVQTVRNYADNPANGVEVRRTPGNHRLVNLLQIAECFGFPVEEPACESEEDGAQGKICCRYSRVSTRSQCIDKNLERQAGRLRDYVAANYPQETCVEISEQASGINSERRGLTKIIDLALAGRLKTLFIERKDRLSRGSYALIARLLTRCGATIVVTETGEKESTAKTVEEEIFHDALAMVYVAQSKMYGKRANLAKRFIPSQSLRDRIAGLRSQGVGGATILEIVQRENHCCQSSGKLATRKNVWRLIKEIERGQKPAQRVPESVQRFVAEACTVSPSGTALTRDVWAAFAAFCASHKLPRVSRNKLPGFIRAAVPTARTHKAGHNGYGYQISGLSLRSA